MNAEIAQKVIEIAAEQVGVSPAEVTPAHHFVDDLNYDSLDGIEFAMAIEDEFEISIPDEEAQKLQTVGQAIEYVEQHNGSAKASSPDVV